MKNRSIVSHVLYWSFQARTWS